MSGNELIAEFMNLSRHRTERHLFWCPPFNCYTAVENLAYHSSWDWLMPVVEKIEDLGHYVMINTAGTAIDQYVKGERICMVTCGLYKLENSKIESVYKTVVEFIKWYNSTKETTTPINRTDKPGAQDESTTE